MMTDPGHLRPIRSRGVWSGWACRHLPADTTACRGYCSLCRLSWVSHMLQRSMLLQRLQVPLLDEFRVTDAEQWLLLTILCMQRLRFLRLQRIQFLCFKSSSNPHGNKTGCTFVYKVIVTLIPGGMLILL
jgi:hypothetical protein